jgi:POT family proton-dependent oligopeptide transporter
MRRNFGKVTLTSEQVNTISPLLVIILVPLFDRVIYKGLDYFNMKPSPLKRIGIGFIFTAASFICAGTLQVFIEWYGAKDPLHVLWQFPQHLLLVTGEVLVSVTGLEFAYSQAPKSMKSFIQSFYLFTGMLFVTIVCF